MKPKFEKAGVSTFTFSKAESYGVTRIRSRRQDLGETYNGNDVVVTYNTPKIDILQIPFKLLTSTDITGLIAFFDDTNVDWMANTFYYTDYNGIQYNVRLANAQITQQILTSGQKTDLTMNLKVQT